MPNNLSMFQKLENLDLSKNNFNDYQAVGKALSTIPNLKRLKIDLFTQDNAYYILSNLPNLDYLNDKQTKEDQSPIDISDQEMDNTSLKNEIPNFNSITKRIITKLQISNQPNDIFYSQFQNIFKQEIDNLQNLNENVPNYLYAIHVLNAKIEIYSFLQNQCINMLNYSVDNELIDIIKTINHFIKMNEIYSIELLQKISGNFEKTLTDYKKINEEKSQKISELFSKNQNLELQNKNLMVELGNKNQEITLKNQLMLQKEKDIEKNKITPQITTNTNKSISTTEINNKPKEPRVNIINIQPKKPNSNTNQAKNNKIIIGPINKRSLTIKGMLEVINEIYQSKIHNDKKLADSNLQKETLEQHMYTYLNYKYGLKNLVIEWATAIIEGIRKYSRDNSEICLFGKILRNEIEENEILIISKLKSTINSYLEYFLQNKYTLKTKGDIVQLVNKIKTGYLNEEEWKSIISYLFPNENDLFNLTQKISSFIAKTNSNNLNENKISYQKFIQMIIEFQIRLRDVYLKRFNELFKSVDTDKNGILNSEEFVHLIELVGVYNNEQINQLFSSFIRILDPFNSGNILYSDIIELFASEMTYDKDPETEEIVKMSILDKLSI